MLTRPTRRSFLTMAAATATATMFGSQLAAFYSSVASVDATGPAEVTIKLKSPNIQFRYTAAHMAGFIFQKKQLEAHGKDIGSPDVLVLGTGPYKLTEFAPGDHAVVEANPA